MNKRMRKKQHTRATSIRREVKLFFCVTHRRRQLLRERAKRMTRETFYTGCLYPIRHKIDGVVIGHVEVEG
jgi:hypothetical protein